VKDEKFSEIGLEFVSSEFEEDLGSGRKCWNQWQTLHPKVEGEEEW
jgi:hypothetical protein